MKKIFLLFIFILNFENCYAENKIAYIDINHILNHSIVGQSISKHIKKIKEKKNNELVLIKKKLTDKEEDIIKKKNIIEKNEFEKQVNILKKEIGEYRNKKIKINEEIDKKKIKYTKIVLNTLNPIISKYVEENSITIVFPKKSIVIAKKNLDITISIMNLLNDQLKKIDF
jgi:outer membrane protein